MLKNKKVLIIGIVGLLVALFAVKTFVLKPAPPDPKKLAKEPGPTYVIATPFVVNLRSEGDGGVSHFVKADLALKFSMLSAAKIPASAEGSTAAPIEEEPEIRDIINSILAAKTASDLLSAEGREDVKKKIVFTVNKKTDLKILDVYYQSLAVQ